MSTLKKNQHYVWQYYLGGWALDGKVWCKRRDQINPFNTSTQNIAVERYFYQLFELTPDELDYLKITISQAIHQRLREINQGWVDQFQFSFKIRKLLERAPMTPQVHNELEEQLRDFEKTHVESFHSSIEEDAVIFIDNLRKQDASFLREVNTRNRFINFISHQFCRTASMRNILIDAERKVHNPSQFNVDMERLWPVLSIIFATNIASSIVSKGSEYKIVFIRNNSNLHFITGDQPVISLKRNDENSLDLYYPLTPDLAMIFTADELKFQSKYLVIGDLEIQYYNHLIYSKSNTQIFGNAPEYLRNRKEI